MKKTIRACLLLIFFNSQVLISTPQTPMFGISFTFDGSTLSPLKEKAQQVKANACEHKMQTAAGVVTILVGVSCAANTLTLLMNPNDENKKYVSPHSLIPAGLASFTLAYYLLKSIFSPSSDSDALASLEKDPLTKNNNPH